ncbi:MAG TPA: 2-C-methyl-D-erythritol 4-phosphate cytidylyltransferase, partial [Tepidisphaeraceae bacterium]|nr:2-C-methyl-D-erythritol 4-phosphate cytidylyltransferase [Tepidisphaeraceae bacterium]
GSCRTESVRNALARVPAETRWVAVHYAARPLISDALIDRAFRSPRQYGSAVPALPVKLTIKQATGPLPARVERTLPRSTLWEMQTPQVLPAHSFRRAYDTITHPLHTITDDAQLLELI